jgi:hypothetical protein
VDSIHVNPINITLTGKFTSDFHPNACGVGYPGTAWYCVDIVNGYQRLVMNPGDLDVLCDENGGKMPTSGAIYDISGLIMYHGESEPPSPAATDHNPIYITSLVYSTPNLSTDI